MPEQPPPMSLLFDVWLIMHSMTTLVDDALEPSDLSGDDFGLYSLLRRFGPATPTQIARWTGMKPTTVSFALKRLVQRGHATQLPHPTDGRSYLVGLNEAGIAAHGAAGRLFLEAMGKLSAELGADHGEERARRCSASTPPSGPCWRSTPAPTTSASTTPPPLDALLRRPGAQPGAGATGPGLHRVPPRRAAPRPTHPLTRSFAMTITTTQPTSRNATGNDATRHVNDNGHDLDEAVAGIIESLRHDRHIPGLSIAIADCRGLRHASAFGPRRHPRRSTGHAGNVVPLVLAHEDRHRHGRRAAGR